VNARVKNRSSARSEPLEEPSLDGFDLGVLNDDVLVFRIRRIRDLLAERFRQSSTEGRGLRAGEFSALALIDANPGISQSDLARIGGFDQTALVSILDDLEEHAWAVRKRDRTDRRRHRMEITPKGREALADLLNRARENEAPARNALSKEEFRALQSSLNKIYQALFSNIE
jgi:DNA-binding MarR family transcriptional regulator